MTASDKISGDWSDFRKALCKQFFKNYGKSINEWEFGPIARKVERTRTDANHLDKLQNVRRGPNNRYPAGKKKLPKE